MILKPSYMLEPSCMHKLEKSRLFDILCNLKKYVNYFSLLYCIITKFKLFQINSGEIVYFNETIIKIVLNLLDSPLSKCTDVKTCEFRIETDNEKHKTKCSDDS